MKRTAHAFSLMEMLVVIALITVLMSLTLPSLRLARLRGFSTVCEANIRSQLQVQTVFADEHAGAFPVVRSHIGDWFWDSASSYEDSIRAQIGGYVSEAKIFFCPHNKATTNKGFYQLTEKRVIDQWNATTPVHFFQSYVWTAGYTAWPTTYLDGEPVWPTMVDNATSDRLAITQRVFTVDSLNIVQYNSHSSAGGFVDSGTLEYDPNLLMEHPRGFADGHVDLVGPKELKARVIMMDGAGPWRGQLFY